MTSSTITVTAEDGTSTRVYKVFVTRAGTDETPTPDPSALNRRPLDS